MQNIFDELKQTPFYMYFSQIAAIPRSSGNEEAISGYIIEFAERYNLIWKRDRCFNVLIKKDGSPGYEDYNPVILQCHLDMVCEKRPGSGHDFTKDPILFTAEEGFLKAGETSLGADNGVGIAYILSVLADDTLIHPPIEALFTAGEEVGLEGMAELDGEWVTGRQMVNMDGEEEGILYTSCAGGARYYIQQTMSFEPIEAGKTGYRIAVENLCGGHSGIDIDKGKGNSIILLIRLIAELGERYKIQVSDIGGGTKTNAIPRDAAAVIWVKRGQEEEFQNYVSGFAEKIKLEYGSNEPQLNVKLDVISVPGEAREVLTAESLNWLIDCILLLPNGVLGHSPHLPGVVESSSNLGMVSLEHEVLTLAGLVRANNNSKMDETLLKIHRLAVRLGGSCEERNRYPAWEYRSESELRELSARVYRKLFGQEIVTESIHGGLECALMFEKKKEIDMISIGPDLYDVHTVNERADIASIIRTWNYIVKLLEGMCT